jgi:hypothetical protein
MLSPFSAAGLTVRNGKATRSFGRSQVKELASNTANHLISRSSHTSAA